MCAKLKTVQELVDNGWSEVGVPKLFENDNGDVMILSSDDSGNVQRVIKVNPVTMHFTRTVRKGNYQNNNGIIAHRQYVSAIKEITTQPAFVAATDDYSDWGIDGILAYMDEEIDRIERDYEGEDRVHLKEMLAYSVGHMVLNIDFESIPPKVLNKRLFGKLGTTFDEVKELIRRDMNWQD
ncbi:hypothetical protein RB620_25930 [Paenibacillus sp. LHD-117]|uniref:hypothetical protein n=1 Tax=Paenibacillus sp. LHD-117 TaxID=3071412 RepID=UPI0027E165A0|nr:hypothetical protein [Paenibacillus sp. LHD-117]MDQ6422871.1 hypothetical protein [Paenibacillus sp. LHD-117]